MADRLHKRCENPNIRTRRKLCFHTMRPNHDPPGGGLGRYGLNRQLFRFYSDERTAPVLRLTKGFFPDDSQPIIVTVLPNVIKLMPQSQEGNRKRRVRTEDGTLFVKRRQEKEADGEIR